LWEFHQIYAFSAVEDKDELIRFEIKRSKVKATARPNMVKKVLLEALPYPSPEYMEVLQ